MIGQETVSPNGLILSPFVVLVALEAITLMPMAFLFMGKTEAAADRLFEILDQDEGEKPRSTELLTATPIQFQSVSLGYDSANLALSRIDLDAAEGSWVTVMGPSGSGKSSLLNLILGFWQPTAGTINLGGIPTEETSPEEILKHCAYL